MKGFLTFTGKYLKYMQPLNMIRNYYGEKHGFYFSFLLHYQAWLIVPAVSGFLVFCYTISNVVMTGDFENSLDNKVNGLYGMAVPIWGSLFIISWIRKQRGLQFVWNVSDTSHSVQDERDNDFRFFNSFNQFTDQINKI